MPKLLVDGGEFAPQGLWLKAKDPNTVITRLEDILGGTISIHRHSEWKAPKAQPLTRSNEW